MKNHRNSSKEIKTTISSDLKKYLEEKFGYKPKLIFSAKYKRNR